MCRDPKIYPEPESFKPERFMNKVQSTESFERVLNSFEPEDPATLIFGFGRRICPGRFFADSNAWLMISGLLATFDIKPKIDAATGKPKLPKCEFTDGFTRSVTYLRRSFQFPDWRLVVTLCLSSLRLLLVTLKR